MSSASNFSRRRAAAAWIDYCDRLKAAAELLVRDDLPVSELDLAEGLRYLAHVIGSPGDWLMTPTRANGQPAAAAYYRDAGGTYQALGVAVLDATSAGVARITVFPGGPALVAKFGLPASHPGREQ